MTEGGSRICVVTAGGPFAWTIANALAERFAPIDAVVEEPESYRQLLGRRLKRLGLVTVAGQFATMILIKLGKRAIAPRIERIVDEENLATEPGENVRLTNVRSINGNDFIAEIDRIRPEVILLVGCRMMHKGVLERISVPVLNYHAGITPAYRGMNGGYWALAQGDRSNFGATVHLVDAGVDTGRVIAQVRTEPGKTDNIMTYAYRLAAVSRGMCCEVVQDALQGRLVPLDPDGPSRQWYHPPIWQYLWIGLTRHVW